VSAQTAERAGASPAPPVAGEENSSLDPSAGQLWRAAKGPLLVAAIVLLAALVLAVVAGQSTRGLLDPRAVDPAGSRALAELLRAEGVDVALVRTAAQAAQAADAGSTLLVAVPALLQRPQLEVLRGTAADVVLVSAGAQALDALAPGVEAVGEVGTERRAPACALPAAVRAGAVDAGGTLYSAQARAGEEVSLCYAAGGRAPLVQVRSAERTVTVLGDPRPLTNEGLDDRGNAALALNLLGANPRLVWYLPSLADAGAEERSFYDLVPSGLKWGLLQVFLAVALLALWRARRLGPVVAEPLPVVVRAAETVEGRARLYRRGGARDRAAEMLRDAARQRVVPLLGLPRRADPAAVVAAVAARTGRPQGDVGALLYGAAPGDDAALVRLADELDALEREVRRS